MLDWWAALWSPLWFTWDICNNALILFATRRWIKKSVHDTADEVEAVLCDPVRAKRIMDAWAVPTLAQIRTELHGFDLSNQAALDARLAGLLADIRSKMEKIREKTATVTVETDSIVEKISAKMAGAMGARTAKERKEEEAAKQEFFSNYAASQAAQADRQQVYTWLTRDMKIPQGAAETAVQWGPAAIRWVIEEFYGAREANKLFAAFEASRGGAAVQGVLTR